MTNVLKQISHTCVEWTFETTYINIFSKTFTFQDRNCHLEWRFEDFNKAAQDICFTFKFRSSEKFYFEPPLKVTVFGICDNLAIRAKTFVIVRTDQNLMIISNVDLRDKLVTFYFIVHSDPTPTEENETQKSSDLETTIHFKALSRDFSKLLEESSSSDVRIICEDKTFNAHRIILGTRSTVLSESKMVEGETGLIKVKDFNSSIFQSFLKYLYCGTLPKFEVSTAKQFYEIADKYDVEELKKASSEFMTKNLNESNACDIFVLADRHSDEDFRKNVILYIVEKKIPQSCKQWATFCKNHSELAMEVLNLYVKKY